MSKISLLCSIKHLKSRKSTKISSQNVKNLAPLINKSQHLKSRKSTKISSQNVKNLAPLLNKSQHLKSQKSTKISSQNVKNLAPLLNKNQGQRIHLSIWLDSLNFWYQIGGNNWHINWFWDCSEMHQTIIFIGPRYTCGPIYGSRCHSLSHVCLT